jgi:uncharacterized membrane protein YjfL (UPF0719 family)
MFILLNVSFSKLFQDVRVTCIGGITVGAAIPVKSSVQRQKSIRPMLTQFL